MKADIQSVSKSRSVLDVTASPEEVAKVRADVTKSFAAQASLPGFRKGHAPAAMVAKAYGDRIAREAEDRAVREAYEKAVEENGLKVFEIVSIEDRRANEDGSLSFKATVDLVPTFDLPDLDGIPVDATDTAVTDEQVQAQIDGARRSLAKFEDLAAGDEVKAEDMVQLDYSAKAEDGRPLAEAHPDAAAFAEKKGAWCTVDSEYFLVPGLPKDLVGRKVGDSAEFAVEFPKDFYKEDLRGVKATYAYTIASGRKLVPPPMDEAFFKRFGADSEEGVRARIREGLERAAAASDRARRLEQVARHLSKSVSFDLPEAALERETDGLLSNLLRYNMDKGVSKEDLSKERERLTAAARERAEANLRTDFVVDAVRAARKISLTNEEFTEFLNRVVREQRLNEAQIRELSKNRMALRRYHQAALREKVLSELLEKAVRTADYKE